MYCIIDDVKKVDAKKITSNVDDRTIEEHIAMAMVQVDDYTRTTFGNTPSLSIIKATAIITLSLLQTKGLLETREIISKSLDIASVTYGKSNVSDLPIQAVRLMRPYRKRGRTFIDRV